MNLKNANKLERTCRRCWLCWRLKEQIHRGGALAPRHYLCTAKHNISPFIRPFIGRDSVSHLSHGVYLPISPSNYVPRRSIYCVSQIRSRTTDTIRSVVRGIHRVNRRSHPVIGRLLTSPLGIKAHLGDDSRSKYARG